MRVAEMLLTPPRERPRIDYKRVWTWRPVKTEDEGWCAGHVWQISVDGVIVLFSKRILPL